MLAAGIAGYLAYRASTDLPGVKFADQGNLHIEMPGQATSRTTPSRPRRGRICLTSPPWGVHTEPIPKELQVHNLEDGGVLVQYHCAGAPSSGPAPGHRAAVPTGRDPAPYPGMKSPDRPHRVDSPGRLDEFDEGRIRGSSGPTGASTTTSERGRARRCTGPPRPAVEWAMIVGRSAIVVMLLAGPRILPAGDPPRRPYRARWRAIRGDVGGPGPGVCPSEPATARHCPDSGVVAPTTCSRPSASLPTAGASTTSRSRARPSSPSRSSSEPNGAATACRSTPRCGHRPSPGGFRQLRPPPLPMRVHGPLGGQPPRRGAPPGCFGLAVPPRLPSCPPRPPPRRGARPPHPDLARRVERGAARAGPVGPRSGRALAGLTEDAVRRLLRSPLGTDGPRPCAGRRRRSSRGSASTWRPSLPPGLSPGIGPARRARPTRRRPGPSLAAQAALRALPSVDAVLTALRAEPAIAGWPRRRLADAVRGARRRAPACARRGRAAPTQPRRPLAAGVAAGVARAGAFSLDPSSTPPASCSTRIWAARCSRLWPWRASSQAARAYSNLELDVKRKERGSRYVT